MVPVMFSTPFVPIVSEVPAAMLPPLLLTAPSSTPERFPAAHPNSPENGAVKRTVALPPVNAAVPEKLGEPT